MIRACWSGQTWARSATSISAPPARRRPTTRSTCTVFHNTAALDSSPRQLAFQAVVDDAHAHAVRLVPPVAFGCIDAAEIRAVGQAPVAGQAHVLLDAPEQIGPARPGRGPEFKAEELARTNETAFWYA